MHEERPSLSHRHRVITEDDLGFIRRLIAEHPGSSRLHTYLQACAEHGGKAPVDLVAFLPWHMDAARLADMRAARSAHSGTAPAGDLDSS